MALSRRSFLTSCSAATVAAIWREAPALGQAAAPAQAPAAPAPPVTSFADVRGAVRIFNGRGGTIGVRLGKDSLVVVDSQFPDTAKICLEAVLKDRGKRQLTLFNTHHHGDHTGGNRAFKDAGFEIMAHENVPALQKRAAEQANALDAQAYPDTTFARELFYAQFDDEVALKHYGPAHTSGDITVHFVRDNVVHMGDLMFNRRHPFIDRPAGASIQGWAVLLETVAKAHGADTKFIFGHAGEGYPVVGDRADLLAMRDYLTALLEAARAAIKAGTPREAFVQSKLPAAFAVYDPKTPPAQPNPRFGLPANLGHAFDEVSAGK